MVQNLWGRRGTVSPFLHCISKSQILTSRPATQLKPALSRSSNVTREPLCFGNGLLGAPLRCVRPVAAKILISEFCVTRHGSGNPIKVRVCASIVSRVSYRRSVTTIFACPTSMRHRTRGSCTGLFIVYALRRWLIAAMVALTVGALGAQTYIQQAALYYRTAVICVARGHPWTVTPA